MKKILLSLTMMSVGFYAANAQGKLLIVHNSPDPAVATVDVWAEVPGVTYFKVAEDVSYKDGYFYSIPAVPVPGATLNVHLKASSSTASTDPSLFTKSLATVPTGNNIAIVNGLVTPALVAAKTNPSGVSNAIDIDFITTGVEFSSMMANQIQAAIHHGSIDAPSVYVTSFITTIQQPARDTLAQNAVFRNTTGYSAIPASPRRLHISPTGSVQTVTAYQSNGDALKTLGGKAALVVATGFLDTTGTNTTNTFKTLAYITDATTADGALAAVEIPREKVAGLVQVYHNAADPRVRQVDLYVGGMKQVLGLSFRAGFQSAGFIQDFDYGIALNPKDSSNTVLSTTLRFDSDSVVAVVSGIAAGSTGFTANPDGESTALNFYIQKPARVTSTPGTARVTVFHGATDAPTVSLTAPALGGLSLLSGLKYGNFGAVNANGAAEIPTSLGTVVVDLNVPGAKYKSYLVPLSALDGKAVTVCASGFVDSAANNNGASFRLFAGLPSSPFPQIVFLKDTSISTSINDPSTSDMSFRMFPNPASSELVMAFDVENSTNVSIDILDINGRVVKSVVNTMFDNGTVALTENIRDFQSGLYIVRVVNDRKTSSYKFNVVH